MDQQVDQTLTMGELGRIAEAIDLSHHINGRSKARHPSPLKDIIKFMRYDGMISLAGGLPHPSLFPLQSVSFDCLSPRASLTSNCDAVRPREELLNLTLGRDNSSGDFDLSQFLQYGSGAGTPQLIALARELTDRVHSPPYQYDCLLHPGNTNAWAKVVGLLCEENDFVLCDEYIYPSAQALWIPMGIKAVPVGGDAEGMRADKLADVMEGWESSGKEGPRPRVLYLVPVGTNPTGVSISAQRRKEIYDVCVKHDIIIIEDDPYYCLQYSSFQPGGLNSSFKPLSTDAFIASLTPSFLSMDRQGRVIRLESFSKTLFPALRLGYFIANLCFIERLLRATEVETQDPTGLSQIFVLTLLRRWTVDGYLQWLQSLQFQYQMRRDWLLDAIARTFELVEATGHLSSNARKYRVCVKDEGGELRTVFSFVDPTAGMFLWAQFDFSRVRRFADIEAANDVDDAEQAFAAGKLGPRTW